MNIHPVLNSENDFVSEYVDNDIDEDMKLTRDDYIKLLHHYQQFENHPKKHNKKHTSTINTLSTISFTELKDKAHTILGRKFCTCITPTDVQSKNASKRKNILLSKKRISYCTNSIFNNRGLKRHGFNCRNRTHKLTQTVTKTQKDLVL